MSCAVTFWLRSRRNPALAPLKCTETATLTGATLSHGGWRMICPAEKKTGTKTEPRRDTLRSYFSPQESFIGRMRYIEIKMKTFWLLAKRWQAYYDIVDDIAWLNLEMFKRLQFPTSGRCIRYRRIQIGTGSRWFESTLWKLQPLSSKQIQI